jgi:hypothetical protein
MSNQDQEKTVDHSFSPEQCDMGPAMGILCNECGSSRTEYMGDNMVHCGDCDSFSSGE